MATLHIEARIARSTLQKPLPFRAFASRDIHRVEFSPGATLYKVTEGAAVDPAGMVRPGPTGFATPWWFSYQALSATHAELGTVQLKGLEHVLTRARATNADLPSFLRARGAVCLDWNVMTHVLVVRTRRPVVGLVGACSGQPLFDDLTKVQASGLAVEDVENVRFIGGEQQLYLPGLLPIDLEVLQFGKL